MAVPVQEEDREHWIRTGLGLLEEVPAGLEGVIRQQQAALAFQQAMRCGLTADGLNQALRQALVERLAQCRRGLQGSLS